MELTGMMKKNRALFSGKYTEYITPMWLYEKLDSEFHFTLDPCTTPENPLGTPKFFTKEDDGLSRSWIDEIVYCNPPYGKETAMWIIKAHAESMYMGATVVMLLPSRTDTKWFHAFVYPILLQHSDRVRFIPGRLKFLHPQYKVWDKEGGNTAPFPSMIVVFK